MTKTCPHIIATSVCGALHRAKKLPCQDFYMTKLSKGKLVAVVSDGAGSAKYGKTGAKTICETICNTLLEANMDNVRENIIRAIKLARNKLCFHRYNHSKSENELIKFSATVVGVFYHKNQGVFFHIGDGACMAFNMGNYDNCIISRPENGAYSCETFFYTMPDWQDNLRFTTFGDINRILLMTDGVTGFVFGDDFNQIHYKFLVPIVEYLDNQKSKQRAVTALRNTLNDRKAQRINPDDKTMLWIKLK